MPDEIESRLVELLAKREKELYRSRKKLGETLARAASVLDISTKIDDEVTALAVLSHGSAIFATDEDLRVALESAERLLASV